MMLIYQQFEAQVAKTPHAIALKFGPDTLTYDQLNRRANQLAHYLRSKGIGAESMVGISLERSFEMVIGLYGITKAGGAYVPIDPEYPQERLAFMLEDSQVNVLLTQAHLANSLPTRPNTTLLSLDAEWDTISTYSEENPVSLVEPDNLAYVIYTSGSTGKPKGAMNTHRAIHNRLNWMQEEYQLTGTDVVFQKTPFSFDVSVWEFFWPLMFGAQLTIAKPNGHKDSAYLVETIVADQVSVMHFVPSMLSLFLADPDVGKCTSLRDVICSGEALSVSLQTRFFESLSGNLHNLYGPTEAAIDVSYWQCDPNSTLHTVPIGYPVANTQLYILNEAMMPVPKGEEGELYLGGVQLARGYWNRDALTAERFVDVETGKWKVGSGEWSVISGKEKGEGGKSFSSFIPHPSSLRLYKTGDLARMLPDNSIEFWGRADFQVKLRGFRIELGEIEAALNSHKAVQESVILMREDTPDDKRLVAYVVFEQGQSATNLAMKTHLGQTLPDYMIPSAIVPLETIPLTPNGKRDRRALPVPSQARPELEQAYVAPRTALETYLVDIWQEVLQLEKVGVKDRFFELGGSSLQAAQFVNRVKAALAEFIYVVSLFESPTIESYAAMLERDYGQAVADKFGGERIETVAIAPEKTAETVTAATLAKFRKLIPTASSYQPATAKNPPAIFILAPPRSGTTLLRVMLAGSPELFSAAELLLLGFDTLSEWQEAYSGKFSLWQEGVVRALMEAHGVDADAAKGMLAEFVSQGMSTQDLLAELQSAVYPRTLVDKSPAYALNIDIMNRAESLFENARYIHLVRHPHSMVASFEKNHLAQTLHLHDHDFADRTLGELVWTLSHQNILTFLKNIPANRQSRVQFEALVQQPDETIKQMCKDLSLSYYQEMARPYENTARKMTDGIYKESTPMGDTNFLSYSQINPEVADRWRKQRAEAIGRPTWDLAEQLGYESADATSPKAKNSRVANRQRNLRQSRRRTKR